MNAMEDKTKFLQLSAMIVMHFTYVDAKKDYLENLKPKCDDEMLKTYTRLNDAVKTSREEITKFIQENI